MRVAEMWAGKNWGMVFTPRIGQEVIVEFLEGDPDQPIVTGRVYNAEQMPPYALTTNMTQSGIKTRSTTQGTTEHFNELRFEDKKDNEEVYFHAEKDFNRVVENNDTLKVGSDKADDGSQTIEIYKNRTETVKTGDELVTIEQGKRTVIVKQGDDTHQVDTGNRLVAAFDPHDAVGILDRYSFDVRFFTEFERFDRHLEKLRRGPAGSRVDYVSICSPNYLHDAHIRLALRVGARVICEKPLVINPWNLDALEELEAESGGRVSSVLQLRLHPSLLALKARLDATAQSGVRHDVCLTYITTRGRWYDVSWKGSLERSGGIVTNIGIHFFDLLLWLFGPAQELDVHHSEPARIGGSLQLERASVRWFLSTSAADLPFVPEPGGRTTYRSITVDGEDLMECFDPADARAFVAEFRRLKRGER